MIAKHIHILGICGTFMGGVALLAQQQGYRVTGADTQVYPPMSEQLQSQGIELIPNYQAEQLIPVPDHVIVGNALARGKQPVIETLLNQRLAYSSGPQWVATNILAQRHVLAVAGTHGKTTTSSMLAWILDDAGLQPGFLIGGIPRNFGVSARLGTGRYFVIEADEYDSAFFDKRPKFLHYAPQIVVLTNLEFDHADIFNDLAAIQTQFHYLLRTVPSNGRIIAPIPLLNFESVLTKGCWTPIDTFGLDQAEWQVVNNQLYYQKKSYGELQLTLLGAHNQQNALAAIAAAYAIGVPITNALTALAKFKGVKRRLELIGQKNNINLYEDFAHHPTAIAATLTGLRQQLRRIIAVVECASNTMRLGGHASTLVAAFAAADYVILKRPNPDWGIVSIRDALFNKKPCYIAENVSDIIDHLLNIQQSGDNIVFMSNKSFDGLTQAFLKVW